MQESFPLLTTLRASISSCLQGSPQQMVLAYLRTLGTFESAHEGCLPLSSFSDPREKQRPWDKLERDYSTQQTQQTSRREASAPSPSSEPQGSTLRCTWKVAKAPGSCVRRLPGAGDMQARLWWVCLLSTRRAVILCKGKSCMGCLESYAGIVLKGG